MPYKCSVKRCRSNYDSTNEKVSMFQFPTDDKLKSKWLNNIELNSKLTNSSRVCIKHFKSSDIEASFRRSVLKPYAIPVRHLYQQPELSDQVYDDQDESAELGETDSDLIHTFEQFSKNVDEMSEDFIEHWNIYTQPDGVCFYRLTSDENFIDVNMSFKILVNNDMRVKIYSNGIEASDEELMWTLVDSHLLSWSQFERILLRYQNEPEILRKNQPTKYLQNALEALDLVQREELQEKIDLIKIQIVWLLEFASALPDLEQPLQCDTIEPVEDEQALDESYDHVVETLEEFLEYEDTENELEATVKSDYYKEPPIEVCPPDVDESDRVQSDISGDEEERIIEYEDPLKCPNCLITLMSENGFQSHTKTCKVKRDLNLPVRRSKLPDSIQPTKPDVNVCDVCGKSFGTIKALKEHMKMHNKALRKKCPHCDLVIFSGVLMRHIKAVHDKVKPHKCSICDKAFSTTSLRNDHERIHQRNLDLQQYLVKVDGSPQYSCPKCSAHYETTSLLKKHMEKNCRLAQKKRLYRYPCGECSKTFTTKIQAAHHLLKIHLVEIQNINKYCFECRDEFDDYANHVKVHSCNFACSFCGSKFLTHEKALKHEQSKHSQETIKDRPFKCLEEDCGYSFKNINHLRSHQQAIHVQQEKELQCNQCDKKFGLRAHLTIHIRQHNASFPCNFEDCERVFKKLNNLKDHFIRDHGISEIYLCPFEDCGVRFKMLSQLKSHSENEHGTAFNTQKYFES